MSSKVETDEHIWTTSGYQTSDDNGIA